MPTPPAPIMRTGCLASPAMAILRIEENAVRPAHALTAASWETGLEQGRIRVRVRVELEQDQG